MASLSRQASDMLASVWRSDELSGLTDTDAPPFVEQWKAFTAADELPAGERFICVQTWMAVPLLSLPAFLSMVERVRVVLTDLGPESLVGFSFGVAPFHLKPVFETYTIWRRRTDMSNFVRSPLHTEAMYRLSREKMPGSKFFLRRAWIDPVNMPKPDNPESVREFISRLKNGEFEDAPSRFPSSVEQVSMDMPGVAIACGFANTITDTDSDESDV